LAGIVSGLASALNHMSGWLAIGLITALVFGETAIFLGFVLPGEAAVVLGGVLASRGRLSIWALAVVVVVAAVTGPLVGYEVGRRMGDRLFDSRALRRVPGAVHRARSTLRDKGGLAVLGGRFVAVLRALMPAAAGAVRMPLRRFVFYDIVGGVIWGVGYSLLGYVAGSAYGVVERRVGTGLAVAVAAVVLALVAAWAWRRRRTVLDMGGTASSGSSSPEALSLGALSPGALSPGHTPDPDGLDPDGPDPVAADPAAPGSAGPDTDCLPGVSLRFNPSIVRQGEVKRQLRLASARPGERTPRAGDCASMAARS
jgi:membrane-associated protein